jgi:hypothetical protein
MLKDQWFSKGIVIKGARSGAVETLPEPYSEESAGRLARNYASLWAEPIEWWGIGLEHLPSNLALPKHLRSQSRRSASAASW